MKFMRLREEMTHFSGRNDPLPWEERRGRAEGDGGGEVVWGLTEGWPLGLGEAGGGR